MRKTIRMSCILTKRRLAKGNVTFRFPSYLTISAAGEVFLSTSRSGEKLAIKKMELQKENSALLVRRLLLFFPFLHSLSYVDY